jgi:hypothetical protein
MENMNDNERSELENDMRDEGFFLPLTTDEVDELAEEYSEARVSRLNLRHEAQNFHDD